MQDRSQPNRQIFSCHSDMRFANPRHLLLHDLPLRLPFRVEMWDRNDQHVRWVLAASWSVAIGHAALDAAIANYPGQRFTLRNHQLSTTG